MFRAIRQCTGGENTTIVGIVKQSLLEKEELSVINHLNAGLDKLVMESSLRAFWTNEIIQLVQGPVKTACRSDLSKKQGGTFFINFTDNGKIRCRSLYSSACTYTTEEKWIQSRTESKKRKNINIFLDLIINNV